MGGTLGNKVTYSNGEFATNVPGIFSESSAIAHADEDPFVVAIEIHSPNQAIYIRVEDEERC